MALVIAHQIETRCGEAQARYFESAAQQRTEAKRGRDFGGPKHRLGAEGGIIANNEIFQIKAGLREHARVHGINVNRPSKRRADRSGDARPQTRGPGANQKQRQQQRCDA